MPDASPNREFLDHLLQSVLTEPDEAELRTFEEKGRRGGVTVLELLPSDDDRDRLEANGDRLTNALATLIDAYGSKHQARARFVLADLDGDDYEDEEGDEDDDGDSDDGDSDDGDSD
jgi:predicted RNA-binding protein YlqC (UPF0109 family)